MPTQLKLDGPNFLQALDLIQPPLDSNGRRDAIKNASQIIAAVVKTYEDNVKAGEVGENGQGPSGTPSKGRQTGLVYGRIQSGKTRAMITSAALAFDNKFQVVVIVTSNNNRLVEQTYQDFRNGLSGGIRVFSKSHFGQEESQAKSILQTGNGGIVIVCAKGSTRLNQVITFLDGIGAGEYPALIFDDEGDQATLDTHNLARSTRDPFIQPSTIHSLLHDPAIHSLRESLPRHIFVSVTGTPSGIVLQNVDSRSKPAFIELLEAGRDYIGGEVFFSDPNPANNKLIAVIDENERLDLLNGGSADLPSGLKQAIMYFLLSAAAAGVDRGWPDDAKGYKLLCHPSVKTSDQDTVAALIRSFLTDLSGAFTNASHHLYNDLVGTYSSLKLQNQNIPFIGELLSVISQYMNSREILLLNSNTTGEDLPFSRYFNFLIGGNTLGRGLAIRNLLVTYYVREAKKTQMDTMYQHARMFGYRKSTLPFTKVFLPPQLYERFRQIYISDEGLREFVQKNLDALDSLPVRITKDIFATRRSILDARMIDVLVPGRQIYPNYPYFSSPQSGLIRKKIHRKLRSLLPSGYLGAKSGRDGVRINVDVAKKILALVKTNGTNIWNDKKIAMIVSYLGQQYTEVVLKFRKANRTPGDKNGLLYQGVLTGSDVRSDVASDVPVLWLFDMKFTHDVDGWDGSEFIYPTLVLPENAQLVIFNRS